MPDERYAQITYHRIRKWLQLVERSKIPVLNGTIILFTKRIYILFVNYVKTI